MGPLFLSRNLDRLLETSVLFAVCLDRRFRCFLLTFGGRAFVAGRGRGLVGVLAGVDYVVDVAILVCHCLVVGGELPLPVH